MKILIAGLGSIGQRHARNLRALFGDRVELIAHRTRRLPHVINDDMTLAPAANVEEHLGIRSFDSLAGALAETPVAAFVCNPSSHHMATALAAARAGCHLFIEKPLASAYDNVDALIALVDSRRLTATVGYQMRFHPALLRLRDLLRSQAIGEVTAVRAEWCEYLPDAHPYEAYRDSYAARADLGGGVILSYIHEFDYLYWLFGLPRRVSARGGRLGLPDIDVEDTAVSCLTVDIDGRPVSIQLRQTFAQPTPSRTCEVIGSRGAIHVDWRAPAITVRDHNGETIAQHTFAGFRRNQLFVGELEHFFSAMDGAHPPSVSVREAAQSLRIALAARESLATGHVVELTQ